MEMWTAARSASLYGIENWGEGYFDISEQGNVLVRPNRNGASLDLFKIVQSLEKRGIDVPILLRFDGIIRDRVQRIQNAFNKAIEEFQYQNRYQSVFPIKVNQQRHVVDTVRLAGRDAKLGLEVGSKPELVAVLAIHDSPGALLLCNGYKDREYLELALLARKLGRRTIIIVEQPSEIGLILELAEKEGVEAEIGLRMKPVAKGRGHWESSSGDRAKFGLNASELMEVLHRIQAEGKSDWVKLLHFHVGSQITAIAAIKTVLREATRMYTELAKLCPKMEILDVGGGLAVDYDGSKTSFQSSMNYSVEEYARDVVYSIQQACKDAGVRDPMIVTESGRATVAHHSVLVAEVVDVTETLDPSTAVPAAPSDHKILKEFEDLRANVNVKNCHEFLHDALSLRDNCLERFIQGDMSLVERAHAELMFWHVLARIRQLSSELKYVPEDVKELDEYLLDTYFCNFSVFQSLPDSWAIDQLFPIMPIHRLREEPTRRGVLADMSCDSDGKIDHFVDLKDVKRYLNLHPVKSGEPYYLAIFLVGAYQEILGDLHNLFGDTNAVHVDVDERGEPSFTEVVEGDTVREALSYVQYDTQDLVTRLRQSIERRLREGGLTDGESARLQKRFKEALDGYTYLCV